MTALPDSIIQNGLFCCWKYEERNGRKTKVPYQPETGLGAKSNDPSSFVPYKTAVQASGYDGIGIGIFNGICAIDLDNCVSDSGYYTQTAAEIVALMHSYTEYSPSGNGLHILFSAKGFQYDTKRFYIMNHQAGIEVYVAGATNKYVTVTGNRCEDYEYGDRTQELQVLLDKFMRRPEVGAENAINAKNSDLSMEQLLQLAKSSKNGAAFTALWNGSLEGYSSPSEADLALCSHLAFWTGRDAAKMDTMFRQSGLMRDKWDRQQAGTTYGAITIQKAIEHCREIYTPKAEPSPVFQPIVPLTPQWSDLPAFPVDALPDVIRNYVSAVAEHSQTAPDMAAVISLGVLATCLQGKYKIEGTPGYCEPLSLYTVVIAAPGERKSSVMRDMTTFLYQYEQEYNKAHSMEIRENHLQRESMERQISGLQKKLERKESREMELELRQLQEQLEETPELKPVRFFADDCSSEALTSLMAANNGVFSVISTEGGIFDIMAGRYSNKSNIDVWLKGHCGDAQQNAGLVIVDLDIDRLLAQDNAAFEEAMNQAEYAYRGGSNILIRQRLSPEREFAGVDQVILNALVRAAHNLCTSLDFDRLVVVGGETSQAIFRALDITMLDMADPVEIGTGFGKIESGPLAGKSFAIKGGSIGSEEVLIKMMGRWDGICQQ